MRTATLIVLLLFPVVVLSAKERRKVDRRALKMLTAADAKIYRPLEHGLKDISFEFNVLTIKGEMTCHWLYRAADKEMPARRKWTVKNVAERRLRRRYAASLREYHDIITYPLLLGPFAEYAKGMHVAWKEERGGMTVLTALEDSESRFDEIAFVWGDNGLPKEMSRVMWKEDEEEGIYKVEYTATARWKQEGRHWALTWLNSDWSGFRVLARYEYRKVKGILLPVAFTRINPMVGEDRFELKNLRVNKGISDEEFSKW